jgi:recombinational DNA repair ATPase RecF
MDEGLDEVGWHVRETYAYFGRAMYEASCLEVGLAHIFMDGEFMRRAVEEYRGNKIFDRKRYQEEFDAFMNGQFAQTFGNLLRRVNASKHFSEDFKMRLADAKNRRDFLAHRFWRERSIEFCTESGREKMMKELEADANLFQGLDHELEPIGVELRRQNGVDETKFQAWLKNYMDRVTGGEIVE